MRVLLVNPRLDFAFWNLSFLTEVTGTKALLPPLGLITVAAILPQEWEFRLVDLNTGNLTEDDWNWAEIVAVSGTILHREDVLSIVGEAHRREKRVVAGGPYASAMADEVLAAGANYVVRGEAEGAVQLLLAALSDGKKPCIIESEVKPEMSTSPVPRFDLLNLDDYLTVGIQASRGCPHDCEFCDVVRLFGRKVRHKSPDQILKELQTLYELGWQGAVFVSDDNFIGSRTNARAILKKLIPWSKSMGEPFFFVTQTSLDLGQDVELIDLMTAANFSEVFIGIESPDEEVLAAAGKMQNVKNPLVQSLETVKKSGLSITASFIIGLDGEKEGTGRLITMFAEQNDIPKVMIWPLGVLPGTRLWQRLESEGRLPEDPVSRLLEKGRLNYVPQRPERAIYSEFVGAWEEIYDPSRFMARAYRYFSAMRPTREALGLREESPPGGAVSSAGPPLRKRILRAILALKLIWWLGVRRPTRLQFWRQLRLLRRNNPSRLASYMTTCAFGENMFRMTKEIRSKFGHALE